MCFVVDDFERCEEVYMLDFIINSAVIINALE